MKPLKLATPAGEAGAVRQQGQPCHARLQRPSVLSKARMTAHAQPRRQIEEHAGKLGVLAVSQPRCVRVIRTRTTHAGRRHGKPLLVRQTIRARCRCYCRSQEEAVRRHGHHPTPLYA